MNMPQPSVPISHCTGARGAVRLQAEAALAVAHGISRALTIELRPALTQAEQRPARQEERHARCGCIEHECLHHITTAIADVQRRRILGEAHYQIAGVDAIEPCTIASSRP
jgi:hypothetical protein